VPDYTHLRVYWSKRSPHANRLVKAKQNKETNKKPENIDETR